MTKIKVQDRSKFKVTADESRLVSPEDLQKDIDASVAKVNEGKAFVRPSGTEDVLRLYAEAETMEEVEKLSSEITEVINEKYREI